MVKHLFKVFVVTMFLVLSSGLKAQVTTAGISGIVIDEQTKETLIGVNVVVTHVPTGTVYGAATNAKGHYSIQGLRPGGPYTVKASYIGFQTKVFENLNLGLGEDYDLKIWLKDDSKTLDQVVVTADRNSSFNAQRTGAASSFNRKAIENTPSISRSIFDIASLTPQANTSGSGTSFAGASNKYNSFQIDGTVSNDVFGLTATGTNGGLAGANPISLEAIDAVQVVIAPFDVRQSGFTGGGINAITKSGTNVVHGSVYGFYNDQNMHGTTPGKLKEGQKREKMDKTQDRTVGFTIGAPIVKDKLFLFVNGEYADNQYPLSYTVGDGSRITKEEAEAVKQKIMSITNNNYDGGGYGAYTVPTKSYKALARLDWNVAQGHRLTLRYSLLRANKVNLSNSSNNLKFNNSGHDFVNTTHSLVAEMNSRFNDKLTNEFRFGYNRVRDDRNYMGEPFPWVTINFSDNRSISFGSEEYATANRLKQDMFSITDNLTYNIGNHKLVFGTNNEIFNVGNLFIRQMFGSYTYNSLENFLSIGTANEVKPDKFNHTFVRDEVEGGPLWWANMYAAQLGFYAQDEWSATRNLKLTYGLRVDVPLFFNKPTTNPNFNKEDKVKELGLRNDYMPKSAPLFSPRVGFRYAIDENSKYILRGGTGLFTGRIPFVWLVNSIAKTGMELNDMYIDAKGFKSPEYANFKFNKDPHSQLKAGDGSSPEVNLVRNDFKFPQVLRSNLALDMVLPYGIKATIEGMFSKNFNDVRYSNIWYQPSSTKFLKEGDLSRPVFEKVNKKYYNVILLGNSSKGYSYNITGQLSKEFDFGLFASLAYTYGHSYTTNGGGSSQAASNWGYNAQYYGDTQDDLSFAPHDLGHRIVANISYRKEYAKHFATTIGLIYNGQSGSPFSVLVYSDVNEDGYGKNKANDLAFLPTNKQMKDMKMPQNEQEVLNRFISDNDLEKYKGSYIARNAVRTPFTNNIDLHFAQEFFFNIGGRRHTIEFNADIVNLANMFNRNWGIKYFVKNGSTALFDYKDAKDKDGNKYQYYSFMQKADQTAWDMSSTSSRWHAQIGLKYKF